jgi:ABC-type uncharacterized transport system substrate-binding protein
MWGRALFALAVLAWLSPGTAYAAERRVLVVHSYHPEYSWVARINAGIGAALGDKSVKIETFYMDAKRSHSPAQLAKAARKAWDLVKAFKPDVVLACDDTAQQYFVVPYLRGKSSPQVIFCGVNDDPAKYGYPATNVSGVLERMHYRQSFALLQAILPSVQRVAYVSDDSDTGRGIASEMMKDMFRAPYCVEVGPVELVGTFARWKQVVLENKDFADAFALPIYHTLYDEEAGRVATPAEVMDWTLSACGKPTVGFVSFAEDDGIMCGVLESGYEQGFEGGRMVLQVLEKGRPAGELPVRSTAQGFSMLNLRSAERLGLLVPYEIIEAAANVVH